MGAVGGGLWHVLKGTKNSPSGARFRGGIEVCSLSIYLTIHSGSNPVPICSLSDERHLE